MILGQMGKGRAMSGLGTMRWKKSTRSSGNNGACVELAHTLVAVRDSKNPSLVMGVDARALVAAVRSGRVG